MNWYFYWYFSIYSVYKRFSWDKQFDIFATSMFSFFVASLIYGILSLLLVLVEYYEIFKSSTFLFSVFGVVFFINYMLFLPKQRQMEQYDKYKNNHSLTKNAMVLLLCILSIVILYISIYQARKVFI